MSRAAALLPLLQQALAHPVGIEVSSSDPDSFRNDLYAAAQHGAIPLTAFAAVPSPDRPGNFLLFNRLPKEPDQCP